MNDLKFACRQLLKNPGFAAAAVLTLAVGLGANLAIFAAVDAILVRPLPFPDSDRLVTMFNTYPKAGIERNGASLANYYERRGNIPAFSHIALFGQGTGLAGEAGSTEQIDLMRVSPDFFATLGVKLREGREFSEEEMTHETDGAAILTDFWWRQRFHADAAILGKQIRVDGVRKTIVGVLPPDYQLLSSKARIYLPLSSNARDRGVGARHSNNGYEMIARLASRATVAEAQAQIDAINKAHAADDPNAKIAAEADFRTVVAALHADHVRAVRPMLLLVQAGVLLLLVAGAVNLVNLLLVRASGRAKEMGIRRALGAGRWRAMKQLLSETFVLCLLSGVAGLAIGAGGIRLLAVLGLSELPLGSRIAFDGRLAWAALFGSMAAGMAVAAPIAWLNLRANPISALRSESLSATSNRGAQRLRHGFIVAQIAVAFILLACAGLLGISLKRAMSAFPGFRADHVLTGQIALPWKLYPDWPRRIAFVNRLLEGIKGQPGAVAAGAINRVPFGGENIKSAFTVQGHVRRPNESLRGHYFYGVAGDVFSALGVPLREGRFLNSNDDHQRVCVVDEDFARLYWPRRSAMGGRVFFGTTEGPEEEAYTVVGVVGAIKQAELTESHGEGAVYVPYQYRTVANIFAVVRTKQPPESYGPTLQKLVRAIDPELPVNDLRSMEVRISESLAGRRSPALLIGVFAGAALMLSAIGTYGVLAYAVSQRRREIGVRMALGAMPRRIALDFLVLGVRLLAVGSVLGLIGACLAARAMQSVLFGVPAIHATTLAAAAIVLTIVSLTASVLPVLRASRVNPTETLQS